MSHTIHAAKRWVILPLGLFVASLPFLTGCTTSYQTRASLFSNHISSVATNFSLSSSEPLTVEKAVQQALAGNGRIASLRAAVEVATQRRRAATDLKDPVIQGETLSSYRSGSTSPDDFGDSRVSVSLPVPNPWLLIPRIDARAAELRAAEADLHAAVWLTTCDVRRLFEEINYLTNDLALATELARLDGNILKTVKSRAEQGAATATDVVTASRRQLQIQDDLDKTLHRYKLARRELAALLNMTPESLRIVTTLPPTLPLPASEVSFDRADRTAKQCRADLAALHWRTLAAGYAYREARNVRMPWLKEVKAGYRDRSGEWVGGISMDVPIFSMTKNHADDVALAQETQAHANEAEGMLQVRQEILDAIDDLDESRRQQARYDNDVTPMIASMRQTLATLRNSPNIMPDQVEAIEIQVAESDRFDLAARWRYHSALANLERVVGTPLSELLKTK